MQFHLDAAAKHDEFGDYYCSLLVVSSILNRLSPFT